MPTSQAPAVLIRNASAIHFPAGADQSQASDLRLRDGKISEIGTGLLAAADEQIIDASNCVIYPGAVNTHHHLAQSILKGIPAGLNQPLGEWLASVPYRFWPEIDAQLMYDAARLGLYEQLRSGATTCADHHYLYHANTSAEVEDALWQAADELGIRLVLCRGAATATGSHKGMQERNIQPETLEQALSRLEQSYSRYHDPDPFSMRRLVVAPTSLVHTSPREHLLAFAHWARERDLKLHSHLLEVSFDEESARAKYSMSAVDYADSCELLGEDVWFAHLVKADATAIEKLARSGTAIAHCPTSNCRLGSGIAPVMAMRDAGMRITLGVDGSASSESASMMQEMNLAWLLHRSQAGADATRVEEVIDWGSRNGAGLLGLNTGRIATGCAADLAIYSLDSLRFSGMHSALETPLMCAEPVNLKYSFVNGRMVVSDNQVLGVDEQALRASVQQGISKLLARAPRH
ncbi:amidohydrolase family protein [Marinobacterium sp. YM272]|uniref:amidohydrolase family protein n=1 Tax=Marinobacterium sp. YM272 TaxID=3421654 RepID=UPI003D7F56B5